MLIVCSGGGAVATPIVSSLLAGSSAASVAAGGSGLILGMAPSLAIPVVGAAIVAAMLRTQLILHSGADTCIVTSNWANDAETKLRALAKAYFATPAPRTQSQQQAAMQGFMSVWNYLQQECSNPQLGDPGRRCISDRQDGACDWKQTNLLGIPGEPAVGECFNWWNEYYWPIANDITVPDAPLQDATAAIFGTSVSPWLLLAGAGLVGLVVLRA